MLWTTAYEVEYEAAGSQAFIPIVDHDGNRTLFTANFDKDTAVTNTLPYAILTKKVKILPKTWRGSRASLRVEFLGCRSGCTKSLGVSQDPNPLGEPAVNQVQDDAMTASSQLPGNEAYNGRLHYGSANSYNLQDDHKYFQAYGQKIGWDMSLANCYSQNGGAGVLATIASSNEQFMAKSEAQKVGTGQECFWIGMKRMNGRYEWDDGTEVSYENWDPEDPKNKACVCMSVSKDYKVVPLICIEISCNF